MKLYSVYDAKAATYLNPMSFRTNAEAMRAFETTCKDTKSQFNMYPADFTLVELGSFDVDNGIITPMQPKILANAADFSAQHPN